MLHVLLPCSTLICKDKNGCLQPPHDGVSRGQLHGSYSRGTLSEHRPYGRRRLVLQICFLYRFFAWVFMVHNVIFFSLTCAPPLPLQFGYSFSNRSFSRFFWPPLRGGESTFHHAFVHCLFNGNCSLLVRFSTLQSRIGPFLLSEVLHMLPILISRYVQYVKDHSKLVFCFDDAKLGTIRNTTKYFCVAFFDSTLFNAI